MASQWISDATNPLIPVNLDTVSTFYLDPTGLIVVFEQESGCRLLWTFTSTTVAATVLANIKTAAAMTAIAE